MEQSQRRQFLKIASLISVGSLVPAVTFGSARKSIPQGLRLLFQGDSITDAGRNRGNYYANNGSGLGSGYAYQIAAELLGSNPDKSMMIYNRGISGHKVFQLANRWEDDCIQLKPDVLSILIGVNDFWHTLTNGYGGTPELFESGLRNLIDRTLKSNAGLKLIFGEPFAVSGGSAISKNWYPEFHKYQNSVKNIAQDFGAIFLPYQSAFDEALKVAPVSYWCPDGVHPSIAGSHLMKSVWLNGFKKIYS